MPLKFPLSEVADFIKKFREEYIWLKHSPDFLPPPPLQFYSLRHLPNFFTTLTPSIQYKTQDVFIVEQSRSLKSVFL
jgi:hypothetical protein